MITDPIEQNDIRYNPATACFEAKVTVHGAGPARVYACEVEGDLSLTEDEIQVALRREAKRRCYMAAQGLCSQHRSSEPRPKHKLQSVPRASWLARLPIGAALRAA